MISNPASSAALVHRNVRQCPRFAIGCFGQSSITNTYLCPMSGSGSNPCDYRLQAIRKLPSYSEAREIVEQIRLAVWSCRFVAFDVLANGWDNRAPPVGSRQVKNAQSRPSSASLSYFVDYGTLISIVFEVIVPRQIGVIPANLDRFARKSYQSVSRST